MAPRPNWKGYLKLSLVSCSVALFRATTTSERTRFNIINRETGNRVRYDVVDAETGDEVAKEDHVKGYKVGKDDYVLLEEEELDEVALESTHTIDIESFVPRDEVDEIYLDESYYLVPDDEVGVRGLRGHPRGDGEEGTGRARARGALPARAPADAAAARQGHRRRRAALQATRCATSTTISTTFRTTSVEGHARARRAHPRARRRRNSIPTKFEDRYETALKKLIKAKQAGKEPPARRSRSRPM